MNCFLKLFGINYAIDILFGIYVDLSKLKSLTKQYLTLLDDSLCKLVAAKVIPKFVGNETQTDDQLESEKIDCGWRKHADGQWSKKRVKAKAHKVSPNFTCKILRMDDFVGKYSNASKVKMSILRSPFFFGLDDTLKYVEDEDASELASELKLVEGEALPKSYNSDFTMDTDESFSRIFFHGIGAPLIAGQKTPGKGEDGPFIVDMPLQKFKARRLYKPYGARIHFNSAQIVTYIHDYVTDRSYRPGDDGWEAAKMHAKVTAVTLLTVREHLVWSHLIVSNDTTRETVLRLPPTHPIRRLLSIFTFRANAVNNHAFESLVPRTSFLHRANALKYSENVKLFDYAYTTSTAYQPFPEQDINPALQKLADDGKFPYLIEGKEYYELVRVFIREWLNESGKQASDRHSIHFYCAMQRSSHGQEYVIPPITKPDAMVNLLSTIVFTVTAFHEIIGHVVDYVVLPTRAGFRVAAPGTGQPEKIDLQSYIYAGLIGASTSQKMPMLMGEFPNYIGAKDAPPWERKVWNNFQESLKAQSDLVRERDAQRSFEFKFFDPRRFECSISL